MINSSEPFIVPRTCTEVTATKSETGGTGETADSRQEPHPIAGFDQASAFVLLGAPGSGKTREFNRQAGLTGGHYVSARDFQTFDDRPEWHDKTLFIDGLDEVRAGQRDGRTPLDAIRNRLEQLGRPRFRLSCREADWFGANDRQHLESIAADRKVHVLRLNPLSQQNIQEILQNNFGFTADDAETFIGRAGQQGIQALLENPLSLELLVKAVGQNRNHWPQSRLQTFRMACQTLVNEHNEEHKVADSTHFCQADLPKATGELCAIQLLAGADGISRSPGTSDDDCIDPDTIPETQNPRGLLHKSLQTRLFDVDGALKARPIHRQIAEFMSAHYLAQLVEDGLPPNRILALMSGFDGMIVTELRGLAGWLATLSIPAREELIKRDPLGVVLYGDVAGFSKGSRIRILENLQKAGKKNPWFLSTINFDSRLGDLISTDIKEEILAIIDNQSRDPDQQSMLLLLVEALQYAMPIDGLAAKLKAIICDSSYREVIRQKAIKAFIQQRGNTHQALVELKAVMQEVYQGNVADPDNDLLGRLLYETWPEVLPGTEVLDFLQEFKPRQILSNEAFWISHLPEKTDCQQKAELLDELAARYRATETAQHQSDQRTRFPAKIPVKLLDSFLAHCSTEVEPGRLFEWLGVAGRIGDWNSSIGYLHAERERIRSWLEARPELWKTLFGLGIKHSIDNVGTSNEPGFQHSIWMEEKRRLFNARQPVDFANWCLEQAVALQHQDATVWLIRRVADAIDDGSISRALVDSYLTGKEELCNALEQRLAERKKSRLSENKRQRQQHKAKEKKQKALSEWQAAVHENRNKLPGNKAPVVFLHKLAVAYFGGYSGMTRYTPHQRLHKLLGNDQELVNTVLAGFRNTPARNDLPSVSEVIQVRAENKVQYLWLPFLAGFNELSRPDQESDFLPDQNQIKLALVLFFNVNFWPDPWGAGTGQLQPIWLQPLLQDQPELAAKILVDSIISSLRNRVDIPYRLYQFVYEAKYQAIARLACLPILQAVPVRCTEQQRRVLHYVLIAAHHYCDRDAFTALINRKLTSQSMGVAVRVYWLAAGCFVSPSDFLAELQSYVQGNPTRIMHLSNCIKDRFDRGTRQSAIIDPSILSTLITLLGTEYPPHSFRSASDADDENDGIVTHAMNISDQINGLLNQLGSDPSPEAAEVLTGLVNEQSLEAWHPRIRYAGNQQQEIRREAVFHHADVPTILATLNNRQPANIADLTVLVMDRLQQIAKKIRHGNTSDWKQYWNVDKYHATQPRPENICRNSLLSALQQQLAGLNVDAVAEANYADDTRADIRVTFGNFNLPIEIKRSCHRGLWTAIRTQLINKYTRDPGADGHGIYLVFWFGQHENCQPVPDANGTPDSADELARRLQQSLTDAERRKISVFVIDVEDKSRAGAD